MMTAWKFANLESRGNLLYIGLNMPKITELNVFTLDKVHSKWIQKYLMDISSLKILYPTNFLVDHDLSVQKKIDFHIPLLLQNRRENIVILVLSIKGKIISFETNSMTVKELAEVQPREQGTYGGKATSILRHWPPFNFALHHFGM